MKVVLIFDQGLAGAGGKSNPHEGLNMKKGGIGSALMLKPAFDSVGAEVVATLYCGNEFYLNNKEEVIFKLAAMTKKINPDFAICGPCFNFEDYADMAARTADLISQKTDVRAIAMMSEENQGLIDEFKSSIPIVRMPKKGGTGLNESLSNLAELMQAIYTNDPQLGELKNTICY